MNKTFLASVLLLALAFSWLGLLPSQLAATDFNCIDDLLNQAIADVQAVNQSELAIPAAVAALHIINAATIDQIPIILEGMQGADPVASNWFRGSIYSILNRNPGWRNVLPLESIKAFLADTSNSPAARELAYDLLVDCDASNSQKLIPGFIDDPHLPLQRMAIEWHLNLANQAVEPIEKLGHLAFALDKARDANQIQSIAKEFENSGIKIDLKNQLGLLSSWYLVATFDNKNLAGFDTVLGPEKPNGKVDLAASYDDANAGSAKWARYNSESPLGVVDLNQVLGQSPDSICYAVVDFESATEQQVEIRMTSPNALKVWINGELILANETYHNNKPFDKFIAKANFVEGPNQILVKICQNNESASWAKAWEFQLRVCDKMGKAIHPAKQLTQPELQ